MVWLIDGHLDAGPFDDEGHALVAAWKIADEAGELHRPEVYQSSMTSERVAALFDVPSEVALDTLREQMAKLREKTAASEIRMGDFRRAMKNIEAASRGTHGRS
jgi:hypothetical protein